MPPTHEPRPEFVARLQDAVLVEARRRRRAVSDDPWAFRLLRSPLRAVVAALVVIAGSMTLGGIAVAARYETQLTAQRDALVATYAQRVSLARQTVALAESALHLAEQRVSAGMEGQDSLLDARAKASEAQAQLASVELELEEVRASGRDAVTTASAPLVNGRDFVIQRWQAALGVPRAALDAAEAHLRDAEQRAQVGVAGEADVAESRVAVVELQLAVECLQEKLEIRRRFLRHDIDGPLADLLVLQTEAQQRQRATVPRIDRARAVAADLEKKMKVGLAQQLDVAQAQLRLQEAQVAASRAQVDLALIEQQIRQYRAGK
jgi:outer membrane protein TolC